MIGEGNLKREERVQKGEEGKTILKRALQTPEQDIPVQQVVHLCLTACSGKSEDKEKLCFKKMGSIF